MDAETLSRVQFALTASFHFIFPPLSMGLGLMLVVLGVIYVRTRDPKWRRLSFFWVKVYGLIFAVGVATGIVQEFEFGMNWADYSGSSATCSAACWRPRASSRSFSKVGSSA